MPARDHEWVRTTLEMLKSTAQSFTGDFVSVSDSAADRVDDCPAHAIGAGFPGWSSLLAARQVGLMAVRTGLPDARDAVRAAFDALLADAEPERTTFVRVQDWIATLSKTARLDVADEALRWLVAWRSIAPEASESAVAERGAVEARITKQVKLRASADLIVASPNRVDTTVYVSTGAPASDVGDHEVAARLAAVMWLAGKSVDCVVVLHPKSREVRRINVDRELVDLGAAQYQAALRVIVRQASGVEEAPHVPGPACRWCDLRPECAEGQQYLASTPGVSGGLPLAVLPAD